MAHGFFITGTDTGIGKTRFTLTLMNVLKAHGLSVAGMKPVATGAINKNGRLINEDARLISKYCSKPTPYELINPVVFEPAVAPHIASDLVKQPIGISGIKSAYVQLAEINDVIVVEGIGGWRVPLSGDLSQTNLVQELELPVILVVGLKLGCINHAILTTEAIQSDGLSIFAWVANEVEKNYLCKNETLDSLTTRINGPMMANMPYMEIFKPKNNPVEIDIMGHINRS